MEISNPDEQEVVDPKDITNPELVSANFTGEVTFFNPEKVMDNYVLINDAASDSVFLIDKKAKILFDWPLNNERLGNDAFLLESSKLLSMLEVSDPQIKFGGFGGKLALINKDGLSDCEDLPVFGQF